jgi:hypothetical protein
MRRAGDPSAFGLEPTALALVLRRRPGNQGGLFPVAYTIGTDFKPARRKDIDDIIHWNDW